MAKANRTHQAPPTIEKLGDGSFYYNFDVVEGQTENGAPNYDYEQVRCQEPVEASKIQSCLDKENYIHQVNLSGYEEV